MRQNDSMVDDSTTRKTMEIVTKLQSTKQSIVSPDHRDMDSAKEELEVENNSPNSASSRVGSPVVPASAPMPYSIQTILGGDTPPAEVSASTSSSQINPIWNFLKSQANFIPNTTWFYNPSLLMEPRLGSTLWTSQVTPPYGRIESRVVDGNEWSFINYSIVLYCMFLFQIQSIIEFKELI